MEMEDEIENVEMRAVQARRTFTLRNNITRQVVNFMPSRQSGHNTVRLRRANSEQNVLLSSMSDTPDAVETQADIIVREMEQNYHLMEDNPLSEELRREALRDLPQGLTMKRNVRAKLSASVSLRSKRRPISMFKRTKYRISFAWKRSKERFREFFFSIELWYEAIRDIEGNLGSAVGSYFHLLRWLFGLNLLLSALLVSFVIVPQALYDRNTNHSMAMSPLDFVSGTNSLEDSLLFYGHYHNGSVSNGPLQYDMSFAYFYTMTSLYIMFFAVLCYRTAYSYRRNFIGVSGESPALAGKVFCGWDFGVASARAAALAARALYHEFREIVNEQNRKKISISKWVAALRRATNAAVSAALLAAILAVQYGIWQLLSSQAVAGTHRQIYISMIVTAVVCVCPLLLNLIVKLEFYEARTSFYVTTARTWLLDIGILVVFIYYWAKSGDECWETRVGQEAYRLVMLDAVISLILLPAIELVRALLYKLSVVKSAPEFHIAYNSLTLIYNQSSLWVGMLFSPPLCVAVTVKFLLLFYVKRWTALSSCQTSTKVWRAAQTHSLLYMLITLSLFTTLFVLGILFLGSSPTCGPLRNFTYVYELVSEGLLGLSTHKTLRRIIYFITRPGSIGFVMLAFCVAVYIMRAKSIAQRSTAAMLRQMLRLQAKDKDFLLSAIEKVSNGEWLYSPKPELEGPESHTWKYLNEVRKPSNADFHFDGSRLSHSFMDRPRSYVNENRPSSYIDRPRTNEDGDTDSSFSWQGSSRYLNKDGAT